MVLCVREGECVCVCEVCVRVVRECESVCECECV